MREDSLAEIVRKEESLRQKEIDLKEAAIRLKEKAQILNETALSNLKKTKTMETSPRLIAINRKSYESLNKSKNKEEDDDELEETANFKNSIEDKIADDNVNIRKSITRK